MAGSADHAAGAGPAVAATGSALPVGAGGPAAVGGAPTAPAPQPPRSAETRRLYAGDWAEFAAWCRGGRRTALPAEPATLAAYLSAATRRGPPRAPTTPGPSAPGPSAPGASARGAARPGAADTGTPGPDGPSATGPRPLSPGALGRIVAAVDDRHRRRGLTPPGADPSVRRALRETRARRRAADAATTRPDSQPSPSQLSPSHPSLSKVARSRRPPDPARLTRMAARCPGDLAGLRDRALLLLAAAGLMGEALLALDREHVRLVPNGPVHLAPAAGGGEGEPDGAAGFHLGVGGLDAVAGRLVIGRATAIVACPVRALDDWLRASDTRFGPVFRKVDRWGNVEHRRLGADGLRRIWRRRAALERRRAIPPRSPGRPRG